LINKAIDKIRTIRILKHCTT